MARLLALATASAVAAATILTAPAGTAAPATGALTSTPERAAAKPVRTPFALKASGYGTKVQGGQVPADSDTTSYQTISCTNKAPISRGNELATVELPGLGIAEGVRTEVRTYTNRTRGKTTVVSRHDVARGELGPLVLRGVTSKAKVWHDGRGFHREVETNLLAASLAGQPLAVPADGQEIAVPGLGRVVLGHASGSVTRNGASAFANALKVVLATGTVVRVSHSAAHIHRGLKVGQFRGRAHGTQVRAAADNVRSGPQPLSYMPCQGTFGEVRSKTLAGVDLAEELQVDGVRNDHLGDTVGKGARKRATGYMQSRIARVTLGPLTINAVKGRVNVTRFRGGRLVRDIRGTTLGEIVVDGEPQAIPDPGQALTIPGLARIETAVTTRIRNGIKVTALRLTLLDGEGAVVDLGNARLQIKPTRAAR